MKVITPYLIFAGDCREAMSFYQQHLGGELETTSFEQAGMNPAPEAKDRLIHARLSRGSLVLMASDNMPGMDHRQGNDAWLNVECESVQEVDSLYEALVDRDRESTPPHDSFWGARFAMLTDRYGKNWMLNHTLAKGAFDATGSLTKGARRLFCHEVK